MKKIVSLVVVSAIGLSACANIEKKVENSSEGQCDTLHIINFSEYMKEEVYKRFEKENNVKIVYEEAESNEAMDTKVTSGVTNYDIVMPSDYLAEKWISEKVVQKLDKSLIPNATGFYDQLLKPTYDPNNEYSLPYFWGTVGLVYNKEKVDIADLENEGWAILKNPKYAGRVFAYDSERDGFMPALKNLGYSMNSSNKDEINKAVEWLNELNQNTQPIYVTDQVIDGMIAGEKDIAIVYSGDASLILKENPSMEYFMPKEGSNYWHDDLLISAKSKCAPLANKFINYILDPAVMEENTIEIGYTPPKVEVFEKLSKGEYEGVSSFTPVIRSQDEMLKYNPDVKKLLSELWLKVKLK